MLSALNFDQDIHCLLPLNYLFNTACAIIYSVLYIHTHTYYLYTHLSALIRVYKYDVHKFSCSHNDISYNQL